MGALLTPQDIATLASSFISPELAAQARLFRVDSAEGAAIVGRNGNADYSGIIYSYIWPGEDRAHEYRLRRDKPELEQRSGGVIKQRNKYLSPPGRANRFYIPPGTLPKYLTDTSVLAVFVEGEKKALATYRYYAERGEQVLVIGLPGVWGWRGTVGKTSDEQGARRDVKGPIPDFDRIEWKDRPSLIIYDTNVLTDDSVRAARNGLAKELKSRGACVRIIDLPQIEGVNGIDDLLAIKGPEFVFRLLEQSEEDKAEPALSIARMADVSAEKVRWLWYPYIAFGKLTLLEGDPGLGKSWLTCAMAAGVSCGRGLPSAGIYAAGNVLMLSAEDGLADTLRPRLDAVGADVSRVFALAEPLTFDVAGLIKLENAIIEIKPILVIIDPLFAFTDSKTDIHRANECRAISAPLAAIAERQGCAILALRHLGKSRGGGHALNAGIGSIDFTAAARSVLLVGKDPEDEAKRAIVQTKNNLAPHGPAVGFKLEDGQFYWTGESSLTAGRILAIASEDDRSTVEEAAYFLRRTLEDGPLPAKEVKREARKAGISEATLRRAKDRLGIRAEKKGGHFGKDEQCWVWILPGVEVAQDGTEGAQEKGTEHLQTNEPNKNSYSSHLAEDAQLPEFEHLQQEDEHLQETVEEIAEREALLNSYAGVERPVIGKIPQANLSPEETDIPF